MEAQSDGLLLLVTSAPAKKKSFETWQKVQIPHPTEGFVRQIPHSPRRENTQIPEVFQGNGGGVGMLKFRSDQYIIAEYC